MADFTEDKVKIRFKFRSGDEFEAEGSPDFIEKQRADFLQLINQERATRGPRRSLSTPQATPSTEPMMTEDGTTAAPTVGDTIYSGAAPLPGLNSTEPALYRRRGTTPSTASPTETTATSEPFSTISQGISAVERAAARRMSSTVNLHPGTAPIAADARLWEEIIRVEDQMVFLRRKNRLLTPETAAVVLLAAARILLRLPDGYSALALSKSLKKSGYGGERLDRVLGGAMRLGTVRSVGSKRSRLYSLSDEGFAKAYTLAEKLANQSYGSV